MPRAFYVDVDTITGDDDKGDMPISLPQYPCKRETILLVDDEELIREIATDILEEKKYKVILAENVAQALNILENKNGEISMLFSDIIMPGEFDGIYLAKYVRKHYPSIKTSLTSGYSSQVDKDFSLDLPHLKKPYSRDELLEFVRTILKT